MIHSSKAQSRAAVGMAILFVWFFAFSTAASARADSVITNCANDSQLTTALASGGNITFNCGKATIPFSGQKTISLATTIDGGGKITFHGGNNTRFFVVGSGKALTLNNLVLTNGNSKNDYGGAVYVNAGTLTLNHTTIQDSRTTGYAGGAIVSFNGSVTLNDSVIQRNYSNYGAVNATGTLTINRSILQDNQATEGGGAVSAGGTIVIDSSFIRYNQVTSVKTTAWGGGLLIVGGAQLDLTNSTLYNNSSYRGGGLFNDYSTITLRNVTLHSNSATDQAGGVYNNFGTANLTNVTLSGNTAQSASALYNETGNVGLLNVTFSGNNSTSYGALTHHTNTQTRLLTVKNTVFVHGSSGNNCAVATGSVKDITSLGYNWSDDSTCAAYFNKTGDVNNTNAQLGPLSYNGSSLQTHLPLPGSLLIDGGTNAGAPSTDARGNMRPQGLGVDVGAVEVCAVNPNKPALSTPLNNTKAKGLSVALNWDDTYCADKYKITIKDAATGTKVQGGTSPSSDFKTKALVKGKIYLWFVQACNTIGCTKSDTYKFTVK